VLIITLASEVLAGRHEPAVLPGDHPDTGAEWAFNINPADRYSRFTIGSNTPTRAPNAPYDWT